MPYKSEDPFLPFIAKCHLAHVIYPSIWPDTTWKKMGKRINSNMEHLSKSFFHYYITLNYYFGVKSSVAQPIYLLQLVLYICRFYNSEFNQRHIENIQRKKKFQKVPKARLEFAAFQQLFTYNLHCIKSYLHSIYMALGTIIHHLEII